MTKEQKHNIAIAVIALIVMLLMCLLGGCRPTQYIENIREVEVRDTLIITEPDTASMHALIECDSLGNLLVREIESLHSQKSKVNTVVEYRTAKSAAIKTEYILQTDTIYIPTYHERQTITKTITPEPKLDIGLLIAWLFIGFIIGSLITLKLLK